MRQREHGASEVSLEEGKISTILGSRLEARRAWALAWVIPIASTSREIGSEKKVQLACCTSQSNATSVFDAVISPNSRPPPKSSLSSLLPLRPPSSICIAPPLSFLLMSGHISNLSAADR